MGLELIEDDSELGVVALSYGGDPRGNPKLHLNLVADLLEALVLQAEAVLLLQVVQPEHLHQSFSLLHGPLRVVSNQQEQQGL